MNFHLCRLYRRSLVLTVKRGQFLANKVDIEFTNRDGKTQIVKARVGDTILDTVLDNMIEEDAYGICGGGTSFEFF